MSSAGLPRTVLAGEHSLTPYATARVNRRLKYVGNLPYPSVWVIAFCGHQDKHEQIVNDTGIKSQYSNTRFSFVVETTLTL